jgi:DNA-binding MurR/RpiR family transcriptional regulator
MDRTTLANSLFVTRIEQCYQQLSPNARKVANYLQHNPLDVLNFSVAEIAEITHTSKATVSRFFRQLGYANQQDVKKELRTIRHSGYPVSLSHVDNDYINQELSRIRHTWESISAKHIQRFTQSISKASRITIIGFRNSYPVALHFRQQLLQIRGKIRLLPQPGQTLGEEIEDIEPDELVILVAFRRRPKIIEKLIDKLQGNQLVLMADPSAQIYKEKVGQLFICQLGQEMPLDSYSAPMSVISVICNQLLAHTPKQGKQRIASISKQYRDLDELE